MKTICIHGTAVGKYCGACGGVIKPTVADKELTHYLNAPDAHRVTCERCRAVRHRLGLADE